MKASIYR